VQLSFARNARLSVVWLVAILACLAVPAGASAASVTVRIEGPLGKIFPSGPVSLPTTPVAPITAPAGETCAGNTVVGAIDAATKGNWNGTWSVGGGWSLETVAGTSARLDEGRKWIVLLNHQIANGPPCLQTLTASDEIIVYPQCVTATSRCFASGPLVMSMPTLAGPGAPIGVLVYEYNVTLSGDGTGISQQVTSDGAGIVGPDSSTVTDSHYGTGIGTLTIAEKGPATIAVSKSGHAADSGNICITDGNDGFCGTSPQPQQPFDPLAYCQTTGNDGYCGSPDHVAPVGRIASPIQGQVFAKTAGPTKLRGTVDFDPSLTDHVNMRLVRQIRITVKKYGKKRKVWVTKKVRGKRVRKRATRRKVKRVKKNACYYWSDTSSEFKRMKKCDANTAPLFRATGAEIWTYEFLSAVPAGSYTLDLQAVDGAGNADATPELGRNRLTFKVS
jgi:hypothetical protein